jgi:hypothetical protein
MNNGDHDRTSPDLDMKEKKLPMDTPNIGVLPGQDLVSPGRSFSLKRAFASGEDGTG